MRSLWIIADRHAIRAYLQNSASGAVPLLNRNIDCGGAVMWLAAESTAIVSDCLIQSHPQGTGIDEHSTQPSAAHLSVANTSSLSS